MNSTGGAKVFRLWSDELGGRVNVLYLPAGANWRIMRQKEHFMVTVPTSNFASVKLPTSLVRDAREMAGLMRRSVAGQIEYWATLGRAAEQSGLSMQESREVIESYEAASRTAALADHLNKADKTSRAQLDDQLGKFMTAEADGSLAREVRAVVLANRSRMFKKIA
jgi:ParD-like antitoxin of type II bacterial toxin-antitoxin system